MIRACPDDEIAGYGGGPYSWHPEFLEEHLFWVSYLGGFFRGSEVQKLLIGSDWEDAAAFDRAVFGAEDWPVFTVPLLDGRRIDVIYRTVPGDTAIDIVLHDPVAARPRTAASTEDGAGQILSWAEAVLSSEMDGVLGQGAELLLLLPVIEFESLPENAAEVLAELLGRYTAVEEPQCVAEQLIAAGSA